jgi:hypothetical protein
VLGIVGKVECNVVVWERDLFLRFFSVVSNHVGTGRNSIADASDA